MELFIWLVIFIVSLTALLKAAGWFSAGAVKLLGYNANSGFTAASIAAALPELALALAAVLIGRAELAVPIVIGSSIANIFLVVGASAVAAKNLAIKPDYVDLDAPLLAAALAMFWFCGRDGQIVFSEGILMIAAFFSCAAYVIFRAGVKIFTPRDIVTPGFFVSARRNLAELVGARFSRGFVKIGSNNFLISLAAVFFSAALLAIAAGIALESIDGISQKTGILAVVLAMSAMSVAGALPEMLSSLRIIARKRYEILLGNVFAGTTANILLVAGIAALFGDLPLGAEALDLGLPFLVAAAGVLTVSSFSRKINAGEGMIYLFLYLLFLAKLFNLF